MFSVWKYKRGNILDIISVKVLLEDILELVVAVQFLVSNLSLAYFPFKGMVAMITSLKQRKIKFKLW